MGRGTTIYALRSCDTCRKALAETRAAGHAPRVVDIRADGVPWDVLDRLVAGLGPEALINRRSTTWRGFDAATRARAMDPATAAAVLAEHPTLMKRPVIAAGDETHVGWNATVLKALGA